LVVNVFITHQLKKNHSAISSTIFFIIIVIVFGVNGPKVSPKHLPTIYERFHNTVFETANELVSQTHIVSLLLLRSTSV